MVVVEGPEHARPGAGHDQVAAVPGGHRFADLVDDGRVDPGERQRGRARLERGDAGQRRDEDAARLGLPPGVDHRAALATDVAPVPHPGLGVDRLSDRPEQLERGQVVGLRDLVAHLDERPDERRAV